MPSDGECLRWLDGMVLGFHVDQLCAESGTGWDVLAVGSAALTGERAAPAFMLDLQQSVVTGSRFTF